MTRDPKRMVHSEGGDLLGALVAARENVPSERQLEALAQRLIQAGIPPRDVAPWAQAPSAAPPVASPSARSLHPLVKIGLGALAVGIGVAVLSLRGREPAAPQPVSVQDNAATPPVVRPAPPLALGPAREANTAAKERSVATGSRGVGDTKPVLKGAPEPSPAPAPALEAESPALSNSARAVVSPPTPAPRNGGEPALKSSPRSSSAAATNARGALPAAQANDFEPGGELPAPTVADSELDMLKKARNALSSDPLTAYAIAMRCAREHPRGTFAQERDFITISALLRLGRDREAQSLADSFRSRYPRSAYLSRLERMLGSE